MPLIHWTYGPPVVVDFDDIQNFRSAVQSSQLRQIRGLSQRCNLATSFYAFLNRLACFSAALSIMSQAPAQTTPAHGYFRVQYTVNVTLPGDTSNETRTATVTFRRNTDINSSQYGQLVSSGTVSNHYEGVVGSATCYIFTTADAVGQFSDGVVNEVEGSQDPSTKFSLQFETTSLTHPLPNITATYVSYCETDKGPVEYTTTASGPMPTVGGIVPFTGTAPLFTGSLTDNTDSPFVSEHLFIQGEYEGCGDERDKIIDEYFSLLPSFIPECKNFTQNFGRFNTGDYDWALVRSPEVAGLANIEASIGARQVNSAYRNPVHNQQVSGSAGHSRHMYGDAMDMANQDSTLASWQKTYQAAVVAGADWLEGQSSTYPCRCTPDKCSCVHADWRNTAGDYEQ